MAVAPIRPAEGARQAFPPSTAKAQESALGNMDISLLLWLILLGFGGGLFALYYSTIGYIPDIKWEDSVVYVGALTIAGAFLFALYFLLLFIPGWIWSEFLITKGKMECLLSDGSPHHTRILLDVGLPFAGFLGCVHLVLESGPPQSSIWRPAWIAAGVVFFLILFSGVVRKLLRASINKDESCREEAEEKKAVDKEEQRRRLNESVAFFAGSSLASFFSILLIRQSFGAEPGWRMLLVCTVTVTIVNLYVAISCKKKPRGAYRAFLFMAVAALALLVLGDVLVENSRQKLSARIMCRFGIGFDHPVTLLLTEKGADILKRHSVPFDESDKARPKVGNIEILSRLGSEYFLRSREDGKSFSFPKTEIVSWALEEKPAKGNSGQSPAAANRVAAAPAAGQP